MEYFLNPIGYLILAVIGIIALYQVYYYGYRGKKEEDMELKDIPKYFREVKNILQETKEHNKRELEQKLTDGSAHILAPKIIKLPKIFNILSLIVIIILYYQFNLFVYGLRKTCQLIYGIDALLFKDLIIISILILIIIYTLMVQIISFIKRKLDKNYHRRFLFMERVIYNDRNNHKEDFISQNYLSCFILLNLLVNIHMFANSIEHGKNINLYQANEYYQEQCISNKRQSNF